MDGYQERTEHGVAILETKGGDPVVSLDAVAKIAGVSGGAVAKVLAALDLIVSYTDRTADDLVDFYKIPMISPDDERYKNTKDFARELASSLCGDSELARYLNLRGRVFGKVRDK